MSRPARLHNGAFAALGTLKLKELFLTCHAILLSILLGPQLFCDRPILADQLPSSVVRVRESNRKDGMVREKLRPKEDRKEFELTGNPLQVKGALANVAKAPLTCNALP